MTGGSRFEPELRRLAVLAFCLAAGAASAQEKPLRQMLEGGWILVSESLTLPGGKVIKSWGEQPFGFHSFDAGGNFSQILARSDLPKFVERSRGTPEQNEAVAKGAIAYFGTFSVDEARREIEVQIIGSTFAAFNGTVSRRKIVTLSAEELRTANTIPASGVVAELVWRRAKKAP